ncbi:MAG: polyamine aminopropyltransferase [Armatimonadetes bacterium]|nr:polyamine aminopropyltransferase [Armatimonadota bacterium]
MPKTKNWQWYLEKQNEFEAHMHALIQTIYFGETKYQKVGIVESPTFGKMLILDGDTQSSQKDEFIYHEALVHPALIFHPNPKTILILGGGEGATLREVLKHPSVETVKMIDIDQELVELCKKYLPEWSNNAFQSPKTKVYFEDAYKYLLEDNQNYDVIISDLTEPLPDSPSNKLFTKEFFSIIKSHLAAKGIFVLQASKADCHNLELHTIIYNTLKQVFPAPQSFASRVPSFDANWGFILAALELNPPLKFQEINQRIKERNLNQLKYYDAETHEHIFSLPKYFREALKKQTNILEEAHNNIIKEEAGSFI